MSVNEEVPAIAVALDPPAAAQQIEVRNVTFKGCQLTGLQAVFVSLTIAGVVFIVISIALESIVLGCIGGVIVIPGLAYGSKIYVNKYCCNKGNPLAELPRVQQEIRNESSPQSPDEIIPMLSEQERAQNRGAQETSITLLNAQRRRQSTTSSM
ncbi:hypothetical protein TNIN_95851 [Trichonephila inaurata madagascariensis]|uniref:Uncharacterized protein n=1 Tax=Trichonephila inaurata madagascariensis TaxID=2747483 RepID=A0A8X6X609_9ARAC|nr:hypothetical protein TNIN_95851 [Trichonephila inaurata madagascariensis]